MTGSLDPRVPEASAAGFATDMAVYERGRPSYPPDAVAWLVEGLGIGPGRRVVDLAAGPGKQTPLLVPPGADVTGPAGSGRLPVRAHPAAGGYGPAAAAGGWPAAAGGRAGSGRARRR